MSSWRCYKKKHLGFKEQNSIAGRQAMKSGNGVFALFVSMLLLISSGEGHGNTNKNSLIKSSSFSTRALSSSTAFESRIGANYGRVADNLLPPAQVLQLLRSSTSIRKIKLFDAESSVLNAFSKTNFSIIVAVPNGLLPDFASDPSKALSWVNNSIAAFFPDAQITHVAVGNEVLAQNDDTLTASLVPATRNVFLALQRLGLSSRIKVSTPHSLGVLGPSSHPPSNATFADSLRTSVMRPLLDFLNRTGSPFMVNLYPFFAYAASPSRIPLDFVLFRRNRGDVDPKTGLNYTNMFDAQLDAVHSAMQSLGFDRVPVLVSETGWPSRGDSNEPGAGVDNAMEYNRGLVRHVNSRKGTPMRPGSPIEAYIFALFNENQKPGPTSERNYGLFDPSGVPVYNAGILLRNRAGVNHSRHHQTSQSSQASISQWCLAKPGADVSALEKGLAFACAEGGVDCSAVQANGPCFSPQNIFSHASYAYNSYFQRMGRNSWNCYFQDTAIITVSDPSYGSCRYVSPTSQ